MKPALSFALVLLLSALRSAHAQPPTLPVGEVVLAGVLVEQDNSVDLFERDVSSLLNGGTSGFRTCYQRALLSNPQLQGQSMFTAAIENSRMQLTNIDGLVAETPPLRSCFLRVTAELRPTPHLRGRVRFLYRFLPMQ